MNPKLRVLFLPHWYPNRYDPMPGLFIQRQAEALTPFCDVAVVYVHPDPDCPNKYEAEFAEENEVRVLRVYFKVPAKGSSVFSKLLKHYRFYRANKRAVRSIRKFSPDLVHAHILTRMGILAYRVSREMKIPFVISEHWSRYFPQNNTYHGWIRGCITRFVVKRAAAVIAVSGILKQAMENCRLNNPNYHIVHNVVDENLFLPSSEVNSSSVKTIIHISCFEDRSKNISGFLRSVKALAEVRKDFQCLLVGDGPDWNVLQDLACSLGVKDTFVRFTGLKTDSDLVNLLNTADFLVLSSRYETFASVVVESLSCGIPVVATRVGIVPEVINGNNGMMVSPEDDQSLTEAMNRMLDLCRSFDKATVRATVSGKFSPENIGARIKDIYIKSIS